MLYRLVGDEGKRVRGITLILDNEEFYLPRRQVRHLIELLEKAEIHISVEDNTVYTSENQESVLKVSEKQGK
jgi:hypothetical protein